MNFSSVFNLVVLGWLVVLILVLVAIKLIYNHYKKSSKKTTEAFAEQEAVTETVKVPATKPQEERTPFVNPETGTLMDGPGFERGEVEGASSEVPNSVPANYYFIDDGADGEMSVQHNLCSKSCCSAQWPTPFKQKYDPYVCNNKSDFVPSRYFCSNTFQDSGCLCLSKKQASFLYNRGGNGRDWF